MPPAARILVTALLVGVLLFAQTAEASPPLHVGTFAGLTFHYRAYALGAYPEISPFGDPAKALHDGPRDATGARIVIRNGVAYQHPIAQAQDGIAALTRYRLHHDPADLKLALLEANALTHHVTHNAKTPGAWWYPYGFDFPAYGEQSDTAQAPWYSGMCQGTALYFFTELLKQTGDPKWATAARHTFTAFLSPYKPGKTDVQSPWVVHTDAGRLWIEEYPMPSINDHTVNGFGFALYGIVDYARKFGDARARLLAQAGLTTYLYAATVTRHPGGIASYSISHEWDRASGYHLIVTRELKMFAAVTKDPAFAALEHAYTRDYHA